MKVNCCHFATTKALVITTPTHKQEDDFSCCSKMSMDVIPKLYSTEAFRVSLLFESPYFGNRTQIFLKYWGVGFLQYVRNEKII